MLYDAQQYFPPKCVECPYLIGLIEDGHISPREVGKAEVMDSLRGFSRDVNFEACEGPDNFIEGSKEVSECSQLIQQAVEKE